MIQLSYCDVKCTQLNIAGVKMGLVVSKRLIEMLVVNLKLSSFMHVMYNIWQYKHEFSCTSHENKLLYDIVMHTHEYD